jgi:hypothetical protein
MNDLKDFYRIAEEIGKLDKGEHIDLRAWGLARAAAEGRVYRHPATAVDLTA